MTQQSTGQPDGPVESAPAPKRFAALAIPDFRYLWLGNGIAFGGTTMRQMLNLWQVYELSGSTVQLGLTGIFQAIPFLTVGILAGNVADAIDRRKLLMVSIVLNALLGLTLAVLTFSGYI